MKISEVPPDRFGNKYHSDRAQIDFLDMHLRVNVGFEGSDRDRGIVAEAWWMGDWKPEGRCPSIEEAKLFLEVRARHAKARAAWGPLCREHGDAHRFAFVKEYPDGHELWRCACNAEAWDAREAELPLEEEFDDARTS